MRPTLFLGHSGRTLPSQDHSLFSPRILGGVAFRFPHPCPMKDYSEDPSPPPITTEPAPAAEVLVPTTEALLRKVHSGGA